ncbi:MAG: helicase-associated domain-containing protein [Spirochaetia bacterium]|nr:helicase-associated domain-containing protein [Spirochaetia bacterium]
MSEENVLQFELDKLDLPALKKVSQAWNIQKSGKDKKAIIKNIISGMQDEFYLKGILEKLSSTQVLIYTSILKSKNNILTLGEISRKISLPPVNTEMELGVLKRYFLVYQRKNRERLTNNMDKYYFYPETGKAVKMDSNEKGEKFKQSLAGLLEKDPEVLVQWKKTLKSREAKAQHYLQPEVIAKMIDSMTEIEKGLLLECFLQGGIFEIAKSRDYISSRKGNAETILRKINSLKILIDDYYIDERFIRLLILPQELFIYLQENPILPVQKKATKKRQEMRVVNDLDFYLNVKKMISYISRKGLNLAKSGKIKQIDLKETENQLLRPDIGLFIEKSQIYQIELLLPVMRLLDIVRVKRDDVVLRNDYDDILGMEIFELMDLVIKELSAAREKRVRYEDVFEPMYVPFFLKEVFDECVQYVHTIGRVMYFVVIASMVREKMILSKKFSIKNFQQELAELNREITSSLFFLQLLGLIQVEYPDRWVEISDLGHSYLKGKSLERKNEKGGIILNPDLSMIAIPEKLSLNGLFLLKSFSELKSFDNVYTFQLTKESFQAGLLLKLNAEDFLNLLRETAKNELSQNLLFSIEDWSRSLPLITITDECVVVQTQDQNNMELLLGQISGKKIVMDKISPTTILIDQDKIYETIFYAEKLNLIVKLIR